MEIKIEAIKKVGNRFRKDLGDIQTLANSIKEDGLLQSPLINNDCELVDGQRRIEACKLLQYRNPNLYPKHTGHN